MFLSIGLSMPLTNHPPLVKFPQHEFEHKAAVKRSLSMD